MTDDPTPKRDLTVPSLGLVLGGGGAKGLAHILVIEALDELGLRRPRLPAPPSERSSAPAIVPA